MKMRMSLAIVLAFLVVSLVEAGAGVGGLQRKLGGLCGSPPCYTAATTIAGSGTFPTGVTISLTGPTNGQIQISMAKSGATDLTGGVSTSDAIHLVLDVGSFDPVLFGTAGAVTSLSESIDGLHNTLTIDLKSSASSWKMGGCSVVSCGSDVSPVTASNDFGSVVIGFITDLSTSGATQATKDAMRGSWFSTNAQAMTLPSFNVNTSAVSFTVAAPHFKTDGTTVNTGFFKFFATDALVQSMGVADPTTVNAGTFTIASSNNNSTTFSVAHQSSPTAGVLINAPAFNYSSPTFTVAKAATVPGAPTGVSASAGDGQATVSFSAPASNGGAAISSYRVTASPGGATATGSSSPITISGLSNGTAYTFTVAATNSAGTGAASSSSNSVMPVASASVPDAPGGAAAAAGDGSATVTFSAPSANGAAISSYTVTASPGGATASGSSSPITVSGLSNGTAYTFTVSATNSVGTGASSASSNAVTPAGMPGAPSGVAAVAGDGKAVVSFTAPSANGAAIGSYTVTASPGGASASGSSGPITVSGLSNCTSYTFTVTATNSAGTGAASSASAPVAPAAAAGCAAVASASQATPNSAGSLTLPAPNGSAPSVSWSSSTFSSDVNVSAVTEAVTSSSTPPALSGFAAGSVAVELNFTSGGNAVHAFAAPIELVIPGVGAGFEPSYSNDGGVTWIGIPRLSGVTLPAGQPDGYYVDGVGSVHILTMHATYFGLIGELVLKTWNRASFPVDSRRIFVYLAPQRQANATVVLESHAGKALNTLKLTLPAGSTRVKIPLPLGLKAGIYLVKVNATSGPSSVQRILVVRLVNPK